MSDPEHGAECACGEHFAGQAELTEHVLGVFPPRADAPLDGRYHADMSEGWPRIQDTMDQHGQPPPRTTHAKARELYRDVTAMLAHRHYLSEPVIDGLEGLGQELASRLARWDVEAWATSPEPHLRAAAAIAHQIDTGGIVAGQRLYPDRLAADYQVREVIIWTALAALVREGFATDCDGRVEAAERTVTTGLFPREYTRAHQMDPQRMPGRD